MPHWRPPEQGALAPTSLVPRCLPSSATTPWVAHGHPGVLHPQKATAQPGVSPNQWGVVGIILHPAPPNPTPPTPAGAVVKGTSVPKNMAGREAWATGTQVRTGTHWQGLGHTGVGIGHGRGNQDTLGGFRMCWGDLGHTGGDWKTLGVTQGHSRGIQDTLTVLGHREVKHTRVTGHSGKSSTH